MAARLLATAARSRLVRAGAATAASAAAWHASTESASKPVITTWSATDDDHPAPGLELLVHNISHSDLVLSLKETPNSDAEPEGRLMRTFLARPQFNAFMPVTDAIERDMERQEAAGYTPSIISVGSKYRVQYPTGLDLREAGRSSGVVIPPPGETAAEDGAPAVPPPSASAAWRLFHLKAIGETVMGKDLAVQAETTPRIVALYLPILGTLIPEWIRSIKRRALSMPPGTPPPRKVLVLVSGTGQPRDEKANPADNSTEGVGHLMQRFLSVIHPDIEVVHIPSKYSIFRYDDNVRFVKEQVLPVIEERRSEVVSMHRGEWSKNLKVTVCLADGAPARISAINAACRSYRPDYLHVWRTKTFWDTQMLSEEDVESHAFKKLEMRPATHRSQLGEMEKTVVEEMIRYRRQFEAVRDSDEHELGSFWLRKTGKAVLAVLVTRKPDGSCTYWRGMNVEVSMPTGTLCAERNAIGNALAADQSARRADMLGIAVLSVALDPEAEQNKGDELPLGALQRGVSGSDVAEGVVAMNPLDPCGACMEWLKKISEVNPDFKVLTFTSTSCEKVFITPIGDYG